MEHNNGLSPTSTSQRRRSWLHPQDGLPFPGWMNKNSKNYFIAWLGEYIGTTMYLFFAFAGTMVAHADRRSAADPSVLLYVALSFGFSLAVNVWIFFRVSGGLFNPAVTFAFWLTGNLSFLKAFVIFGAQMLGGMTAAAIVSALFPGSLDVTTTLGAGTNKAQGLFIEMFLTAELVFTVLMLAVEKHRATFLAPIGIGLVFFVIELVGVYFTGGSANPARSFGPCVVNRSFPGIHWIYWVGPGLGALLAAALFRFMKKMEYETAVGFLLLRPCVLVLMRFRILARTTIVLL
ncbi:aquaporin-like protein [Sphaerosporella brunnea]|uniref:Aquaporin-like protein n=1 Tax=Sphaerosporella brunnea TaxID=1250544 RepID=A0A5J5ETR9_9PEZI|nr:aquaporin-like protein [Sphaerosporella brunnea]